MGKIACMGNIDIELILKICVNPIAWDAHNGTGTNPDAIAKDIRTYIIDMLSGASLIEETATTLDITAPKIIQANI